MEQDRPNIFFIMGDNVGWGDLSCYGGLAPTPRIDALADQGLRFKNYNVEAQCTPTRSALLTGRLPIRTGNCSVPLPGQGHYGLAPWEYTLGELFSDAGYATAAFGKWHVGDIEGRLPTNQGFDEWFGIKNTSDESGYSSYPLFAESGYPVPKIWEGVAGSPVTPVADFNLETRPLLDEQIAARAAAFIKRNAEAGKPFFTYVCFTQMHPPLIHHPEFTGKSGGGVYSDTLAELDHRTGQVLDAIDQAGISENTIVVWSSDNPAGRSTSMGGSNGPWRGHFASGFEGGLRAPAIVRWPGKVKAGAVTDEILAAVDWLPTLTSLVGESRRVPVDRPNDGVDASAFLLGHSPTTGRDHVIYYGSDAGVMSVKWRTMKVVFRYSESTSGPIIKPQWPLVFDLLDKLDALGLRDNTIVVFAGDNGNEEMLLHRGTAGFFAGSYFTGMEASLCTPCIARWPGKIVAGRKSNEIVHITDWFTTLLTMAGLPVPDDRVIDGRDQSPFLYGAQETSNREGFLYWNGEKLYGVKWQNFKLVLVEQTYFTDPALPLGFPRIVNLVTDPKEREPFNPVCLHTWTLAHFGRLMKEFAMSVQREPLIPAGAPLDFVPNAGGKQTVASGER